MESRLRLIQGLNYPLLYSKLQPLPVLQQRQKDILIDFVVGLLEAYKHTNFITVTDRLTKDKYFIACKEITSKAIAQQLVRYIQKHYRFSQLIVLNRDIQFVSDIQKCFYQILSIKRKLSTAYYPKTDGQSKNTNQIIKQYLRTFINYYQNNQDELLYIAEFASRYIESIATGILPFFANRGFEPDLSFSYNYGLVPNNAH